MRRRALLATLGATLASTAGCLGANDAPRNPADGTPTSSSPPTDSDPTSPDQRLTNEGFEAGLEGWTVGMDLPDRLGPDGAGAKTTTQRAADGDRALQLRLNGQHDDGTVWVQQQVDLSGVSTLAVDAYSPEPSFNVVTQMAVYSGPVRTLQEQDFDRSKYVRDHIGWKTYEYPVAHDGPGLVAVGINIVWETEAVRFLDSVELRA